MQTTTATPTHRTRHIAPTAATVLAAIAAAATLAWSGGAHAEGLYIGGSVGVPHFGDSIDGVNKGGNGISGKLYGGYGFSPYVSLEGGYADLGRVKDTTGRNSAHAEYLDAVGTLPLNNQWSLLGRVGIAHVSFSTPLQSDSGSGLKLGLGSEYKLTRDVALRGEWERYRANVVNTKADVDQFTVGVRWSF